MHIVFVNAVIALAILILVPLGLRIQLMLGCIAGGKALQAPLFKLLPIGMLAAVVSFIPGWTTNLAWLWFGSSLLIAMNGLVLILFQSPRDKVTFSVGVSNLFLLVGALFFAFSRNEITVLGFESEIILLTAAHFHFAGYALLLFTGLIANRSEFSNISSSISHIVVGSIIVGVPTVAIGITWNPIVEVVGSVILVLGTIGLAAMQLKLSSYDAYVAIRGGMITSSVSLMAAMVMAMFYAVDQFVEGQWLPIPLMVFTHGLLNSIGFSLIGLASWNQWFHEAEIMAQSNETLQGSGQVSPTDEPQCYNIEGTP